MALYWRFASAVGLTTESQEYHMGLYLLYVGVIDPYLVTQHTYVHLACASLYLSLRMVGKAKPDNMWPSYLAEIT